MVAEFSGPAVSIVKHANPCGVAMRGHASASAYVKAYECDPVVDLRRHRRGQPPAGGPTAEDRRNIFLEVVFAPDATEAREDLPGRKNLRLLLAGDLPDPQAPA